MGTTYHIYFDINTQTVVMDWDGYATNEQFRSGSLLMLELVQKHNATKVLADTKDMIIIDREDQSWAGEVLIPKLVEAGCRQVAIISPHSFFNKIAVETITFKALEKSLTCNLFHNTGEAREWLAQT
jgi:hypothetical protein